MGVKRDNQTDPCCNSGATFFNKTSNLFYSDIGKVDRTRMKNKKLQCDIGCGYASVAVENPSTLQAKKQRLEILKMIKLLRVLFKSLRGEREKMKK